MLVAVLGLMGLAWILLFHGIDKAVDRLLVLSKRTYARIWRLLLI